MNSQYAGLMTKLEAMLERHEKERQALIEEMEAVPHVQVLEVGCITVYRGDIYRVTEIDGNYIKVADYFSGEQKIYLLNTYRKIGHNIGVQNHE